MARASSISTFVIWLICIAVTSPVAAQPAASQPSPSQPAISTAPTLSAVVSAPGTPPAAMTRPALTTVPAVTTVPAASPEEASATAAVGAGPSAITSAPPAEPAVRPGDVIVFLGDELTEVSRHRNSFQFPTLVETFMTVRYPDVPLRFVNAGWSHDDANRALLRLERDVLVHRPNVVVICLGLNDPGFLPFEQGRLDAFAKDLNAIVQRCREAGARVWLMTPPAVEEERGRQLRVIRDGRTSIADLAAIRYNTTLGLYAQAVRRIAEATGTGLADWFRESSEGMARMQASVESAGYTRDGLNPLARGHAQGAATLLKAWSVEPIHVRIEAVWSRPTVTVTSHAPAAAEPRMQITADGARELHLPDCPLPWPMPSGRFESLSSDWLAAEMCRFDLRIADGPARGVVIARVDAGGREIAPSVVSASELDAGINLATLPVLQTLDAVEQIYNDIGTKNLYHYTVWRRLKPEPPREPELAPAHEKLIDTWLAYEAGYEKLIQRRPKRVDLHLRLRENVKTEQLPTSQPEE
jgi:lysophospholipase L1-like esterase